MIINWENFASLSLVIFSSWVVSYFVNMFSCGFSYKWGYLIFNIIFSTIIIAGWIWFVGSPVL